MTTPPQLLPFPESWRHALVVVAHPDDPEYGMAAAVSRWTREGKRVDYLLASSGEAGIEGLDPSECGPIREDEQRRSAAVVGVSRVDFLGFPDGAIQDTAELRAAISRALEDRRPDVVLTLYRGPAWAPDRPNQTDHIELGNAAVAAVRASGRQIPVFENNPEPTHRIDIEQQDVENAVRSLAQHDHYLKVLDPQTPVLDQARAQVERTVRGVENGERYVGLTLIE